jgi:GWxTD domain-containing protein
MIMIKRTILSLSGTIPFLLAFGTPAHGQGDASKRAILYDAVVVRGSELSEKANVDIYVTVPYQTLDFREYDDRYASKYKVSIVVRDQLGRKLADSTFTRSLITDSYQASHGAGGEADNSITRFGLRPNSYRYEVTVQDLFAKRDFEVSDSLHVSDLSNTPALSTPLYVSQIEQRGTRFSITPYVGYIMWKRESNLFAFFQAYIDELPKRIAFAWVIQTSDGRALGRGLGAPTTIDTRESQHFLPLRPLESGLPGRYELLISMHPLNGVDVDTTVRLARTTKPYIIPRSLAGSVMSDLTLAIKQLAYVADQDQVDLILGAPDGVERQRRFEEFWKGLDPSPNTVRNEAFEEYYQRIATANERFKSYADGWLTDMGRVYIIYGEPRQTERFQSQTGTTIVVRWIYNSVQSFTFEDNTGFGDFRLRSQMPVGDKYRYRR